MPIRLHNGPRIALALTLGAALTGSLASADVPQGFMVLDQKAIRKVYSDGELDKALAGLEEFQRKAASFPREDSLFLYKYLGVIYSHNQPTREKGQAYFFKLLRMDPKANLLDMYVSGTVKDVFEDAREEVEASAFLGSTFQPLNGAPPGTPTPAPAAAAPGAPSPSAAPVSPSVPAPPPAPVPKGSSKTAVAPAPAPSPTADGGGEHENPEAFGSPNAYRTWIWAGAAAVGAVGAVVGLHYLLDEPANNDRIMEMTDQ